MGDTLHQNAAIEAKVSPIAPLNAVARYLKNGGVGEWLKPAVLKTCRNKSD
jgi:hypothetical protein